MPLLRNGFLLLACLAVPCRGTPSAPMAAANPAHHLKPGAVLVVRATDSSTALREGVTDLSPLFKGYDLAADQATRIPNNLELKTGDTVILGPGTYTWEGSICAHPEYAYWLPGYVDFAFPTGVTIKSSVPQASTLKLVKHEPTWSAFGVPRMAMYGQTQGYNIIPVFYCEYQTTAPSIHLIDLVIDVNSEANIAHDVAWDNGAGNFRRSHPAATPDNLHNHPELIPNLNWPHKGFNPEYGLVARSVLSDMTGCRVIGWTAGGTMQFCGTTVREWDDGVLALDHPTDPGGASFKQKEHFPIYFGYGSRIRDCVIEDPCDVSLGTGPRNDQNDSYAADLQWSGMYVTVVHTSVGMHCDNVLVKLPESRVFKNQEGNDLPANTHWWREIHTKWNMPDGSVGRRDNSVFAFSMPSASEVSAHGTTSFVRCRGENVTHVFHRDTDSCQPVAIRECSGICLKGVRTIVFSGSKQVCLTVDSCNFEIHDAYSGPNPSRNVDAAGVGNGYECGIYLDVRSGSAAGIIDGVSITHNIIHTQWHPAAEASPAYYTRASTGDMGGQGIVLLYSPGTEGLIRNVVLRNNIVSGDLPCSIVHRPLAVDAYVKTAIDPLKWESDPVLVIGTAATNAAAGNHNHSGIYQPADASPPHQHLTADEYARATGRVRHVYWPARAVIPAKPLDEANTTLDSGDPEALTDRSASGSGGTIAWCRGRLERWDLGAVRVKVVYRFDVAAPDGSVQFEVGGRSFEDGDPWCDGVGAKQTCTGTLQDLGDLCQTAASAALILAGKPTVTHLQQTFQINRHAGADEGTEDARVLGLLIEYTEALAQEPAW